MPAWLLFRNEKKKKENSFINNEHETRNFLCLTKDFNNLINYDVLGDLQKGPPEKI